MRDNKKETTFDDYLKEQLKDPEFRKEWDKLCDEDMVTNNDLISREALRKDIEHLYSVYADSKDWFYTDVLNHIDNAPTVEPNCEGCNTWVKSTELLKKRLSYLARPKGEWKVYGKQGGIPITDMCSNCRYEMKWYKNKYNFCPNCGAKMEGGAE